MPSRAFDWFKQAERDFDQAQAPYRDQRHEWACSAAQQAAEKAVKALHLSWGQEAWGHMVAALLQELPGNIDGTLVEKARVLDNFYVGTRYPDGHPSGVAIRTLRPASE